MLDVGSCASLTFLYDNAVIGRDTMAPSRIQTHGPRVGRCNICGTSGPLTEDHTPPKGCYPPTAVELHSVVTRLNRDADGAGKPRLSQNGVKFRTLCGRCNNGLLGSDYDPPLIRFVGTLRQAAAVMSTQLGQFVYRTQKALRPIIKVANEVKEYAEDVGFATSCGWSDWNRL
jgi:hypothetical protein